MQLEMDASQMNANCVNSLLTIYTEQSGEGMWIYNKKELSPLLSHPRGIRKYL
jgi:hypothetical protein